MNVDLQLIFGEDGYTLGLRTVTTNEVEIPHVKLIKLGSTAAEALFRMALPFTIAFDSLEAPVATSDAIAEFNQQKAEAEAKAAAEADAAIEVIEPEIVVEA
jgi:hypothetical protein